MGVAIAGIVTDDDSADFADGTLTVTITANGGEDDRLAIHNNGTGASRAVVIITTKDPGGLNGTIVLDNGVGLAACQEQ